jgi:hypothetical protein
MFFIPFFGAAVTGQNWNVPGWKKGLVALAGPVPGIILGVGFTLAGLITGQTWLNSAAFLLLVINGFNLLPMLPLDGGHLLHATLFCRNRWLDIAFRIVAVAGLLGLSMAGSGRFLMYVAIGMAVGLPVAFKMSKITDNLRHAGLPAPVPGEDRIPVATAQAIITAVKAALPGRSTNKTIAQHALNVFDTLNAKPPGVLGTLGLLALQGSSILAVVLCGFLLILDKHGGGLGNFARAAARQPRHALDCNTHAWWPADAASVSGPLNTTVSMFDRHANARRVFAQLTNRLPFGVSLCLAGDSLFLVLPASDDTARERWYKELYSHTTNTFVVLTNRGVAVSLTFIAPNAALATNIEEELQGYFGVARMGEYVAPWSPAALRPEFQSTREARRDWHRIDERINKLWQDADSKSLNQQLASAFQRGAQAEVERLVKEKERARKERQERAYERLRGEGFDRELLDAHARLAALNYTNQLERQTVIQGLTQRLGAVANENEPSLGLNYGATGYVRRQGLLFEVPWTVFKDVSRGFPAIADWLCQKGCRSLKYGITPGGSLLEDLEGE